MIQNSSEITVLKQQHKNSSFGVTSTGGTVLKGRSFCKVENFWRRRRRVRAFSATGDGLDTCTSLVVTCLSSFSYQQCVVLHPEEINL